MIIYSSDEMQKQKKNQTGKNVFDKIKPVSLETNKSQKCHIFFLYLLYAFDFDS